MSLALLLLPAYLQLLLVPLLPLPAPLKLLLVFLLLLPVSMLSAFLLLRYTPPPSTRIPAGTTTHVLQHFILPLPNGPQLDPEVVDSHVDEVM